jgi:hypothetical protein
VSESGAQTGTSLSNWEDAERFIFCWMRSQFTGNVWLSPSGADEGIDIA